MTTEAATDASPPPGRGLVTFYLLLVTDAVSVLGSSVSSFAVSIWIFRQTGHATPLTLVSFFFVLSQLLATTFAGPMADHLNRRRIILFAELGMALTSTLLLISFASGAFQLWHLYTLAAVQAAFLALQGPAFMASITMLVPDAHRDRANAAQMITGPAAGILGPAITGVLYAFIGVTGAILVDIATFVLAALVIAVIHIPQPPRTSESEALGSGVMTQLLSGFRYLFARKPLLGLCVYFALVNLLTLLSVGVLTPYILDRVNDTARLGVLLGVLNVGAVVGGVVMAAWGGTRPRIHTILVGIIFADAVLFALGTAREPLTLGVCLFLFGVPTPIVNAAISSIMQAKVAPDVQGRVFGAFQQLIAVMTPLAYFLAGPLADRVFEPARSLPAWQWVAPLVGSGKGAGIGLMCILTAAALLALTLAVYASHSIRTLESTLPDHGL